MFQKFFTDTYVSKTIKNIIKNTNIFTIPTVREGDYVVKDCAYIYKYRVILCTESGKLYKNYRTIGSTNDKEYIPNLTHNDNSAYGFYDTRTHMQLGRYLRQFRDIYDIDLMPFYNCFSYQMETQRHLAIFQETKQEDGVKETIQTVQLRNSKDDSYKVFLIPIFFDRTYTIAINSNSTILMKPVIYDDMGPIRNYPQILGKEYVHDLIKTGEKILVSTDNNPEIRRAQDCQYIKCGSQFSSPFRINVPISNEWELDSQAVQVENKLYKYYNNLYLMLQVDGRNTSSIVVLEGDYINKNIYTVYGYQDIYQKIGNIVTTDTGIDIRWMQNELSNPSEQYMFVDLDRNNRCEITDITQALQINGGKTLEFNEIGEINLDMVMNPEKYENIVYNKQMYYENKNNSYLSKLSLLSYNDGTSYPFSDRLIEFLINGVVTQYEYLDGNIEKLQNVLPSYPGEKVGVWSPILRDYLYAYYMNKSGYIPLDDNGYLNKDVEKIFIEEGKM